MNYEKIIEWIKDKKFLSGFMVGFIIGTMKTIGIIIAIMLVGLYLYFLKYGNRN